MAEDNISETGTWFDTKAQKVVDSKPEEGIQLVAPGQVVTPLIQQDIDNWRDVENGSPLEVATVGAVEQSADTDKGDAKRSAKK